MERGIVDVALDLKRKRAMGVPHATLRDKVLSMLFFFTSTRTRNSFEAGMAQLGGHAQFIDSTTTQISHGDTAKEIGEILGRYNDGIAIRQCDWGVGNEYIRAVAEASRRLREGGYVCMTPDGPRGPRRIASPGAVTLAQRTGAAIVPYAISTRPAPRLDTWDRFIVPLPFARGAIVFGPPIDCPRGASLDQLCEALQSGMDAATRRAEELAGHPSRADAAGAMT